MIVVRYDPEQKQFAVDQHPSPDLAVTVIVAPDAVPHTPVIGWAKLKPGASNLRTVADINAGPVAQISPVGAGLDLPVYGELGDFWQVAVDKRIYISKSRVEYRSAA